MEIKTNNDIPSIEEISEKTYNFLKENYKDVTCDFPEPGTLSDTHFFLHFYSDKDKKERLLDLEFTNETEVTLQVFNNEIDIEKIKNLLKSMRLIIEEKRKGGK